MPNDGVNGRVNEDLNVRCAYCARGNTEERGQTFLGPFYAGSGIGSFPHLWMLVNGVKGNQSHCDHIELCTPLTGKKYTKVSSPGMLLALC